MAIYPWPGFDDAYGSYFRGLGAWVFTRDDGDRMVLFEPEHIVHDFTEANTRVTLGNRARVDAEGKGPVEQLDLNTRSVGWMPTALLIALILATPIPWRRRAGALVTGLILVHSLFLFSLLTFIWSESTPLDLLHLSPPIQSFCEELRYTFLTQLGISFTAPLLIWLLVCFRREDWRLWTSRHTFAVPK